MESIFFPSPLLLDIHHLRRSENRTFPPRFFVRPKPRYFSRPSIRKTFVSIWLESREKLGYTRRERESCKRAPTFLFLRARQREAETSYSTIVEIVGRPSVPSGGEQLFPSGMPVYCHTKYGGTLRIPAKEWRTTSGACVPQLYELRHSTGGTIPFSWVADRGIVRFEREDSTFVSIGSFFSFFFFERRRWNVVVGIIDEYLEE